MQPVFAFFDTFGSAITKLLEAHRTLAERYRTLRHQTPERLDQLGVTVAGVLGFVAPVARRAAGYCMVSIACAVANAALKYQSQYEGPAFRLLDRVYKIRRRLGKPGASGDPLHQSRVT
jgi:hypothetical protein